MSALKPKNEISYQYLAALIDGEGCIGRNKKSWIVKISMNNSAETLLKNICKQHGGKFRSYISKKSGVMHSWTLENKKDIKKILSKIIPFMQLGYKINRGYQAIEWSNTTYNPVGHLNTRIESPCIGCGVKIVTNAGNYKRIRCEICKSAHLKEYSKNRWANRGVK